VSGEALKSTTIHNVTHPVRHITFLRSFCYDRLRFGSVVFLQVQIMCVRISAVIIRLQRTTDVFCYIRHTSDVVWLEVDRTKQEMKTTAHTHLAIWTCVSCWNNELAQAEWNGVFVNVQSPEWLTDRRKMLINVRQRTVTIHTTWRRKASSSSPDVCAAGSSPVHCSGRACQWLLLLWRTALLPAASQPAMAGTARQSMKQSIDDRLPTRYRNSWARIIR